MFSTRSHTLFFVLIAIVALAACSRAPLDSSAAVAPLADPGPLVGGRIVVTLYSGEQANGSGYVDLIWPDGSKQSLNAAPACTFTALTQPGAYRVQFRDQNAVQPAATCVTLSPAAPQSSVHLQVAGAALQVVAEPFQSSDYAFAPRSFHYNIQVQQAPADAQDMLLDIDPVGLPPAWSYRFGDAVVRGDAATTLVVDVPEGSTAPTAALKVRARVGSIERLSQTVNLQRAWSLSFSAPEQGRVSHPGANTYCEITYALSISASGMPGVSNGYLRKVSGDGVLVGDLGGGLVVPLNATSAFVARTTTAVCGTYVVQLVVGSYVSPPLAL